MNHVWLNIDNTEWERFKYLKNKMSKRMWWYMENSEIPDLNYTSGMTLPDIGNSLDAHLSKCNKSALIHSEITVVEEFAEHKAQNQPVYIGKEIISESFDGYMVAGRFAKNTYIKLSYYFQSGIQQWWQKHLSWSIIVKRSNIIISLPNHVSLESTITQTKSLCVIPFIGFFMSSIAFLVFERKVCGLCIQELKKNGSRFSIKGKQFN